MKRRVIIGLCVFALVLLAGFGLYHCFDTEEPEVLDGTYTCVDNEKLLEILAGDWLGADGCFKLSVQSDGGIIVLLNGETVLKDTLQFSYLQPGDAHGTELELRTGTFTAENGGISETVKSLYYAPAENGTLTMKLEDTDENETIVIFRKTEYSEESIRRKR